MWNTVDLWKMHMTNNVNGRRLAFLTTTELAACGLKSGWKLIIEQKPSFHMTSDSNRNKTNQLQSQPFWLKFNITIQAYSFFSLYFINVRGHVRSKGYIQTYKFQVDFEVQEYCTWKNIYIKSNC